MYCYIFTVRARLEDFVPQVDVDCFLEIKSYSLLGEKHEGKNPEQILTKYDALFGDPAITDEKFPSLRSQIYDDSSSFNALTIRARLNGSDIHCIKTDYPLSRNEFETLIDSKFKSGDLSTFMNNSKI